MIVRLDPLTTVDKPARKLPMFPQCHCMTGNDIGRSTDVEDAMYGIEARDRAADGQSQLKSVAGRTVNMTESHVALELVRIYRDRTNQLN